MDINIFNSYYYMEISNIILLFLFLLTPIVIGTLKKTGKDFYFIYNKHNNIFITIERVSIILALFIVLRIIDTGI